MEIVREIGLYKKENNLTILQRGRWNEILESRHEFGRRKNLSDKFVRDVFQAIHKESIHHQASVMNENVYDALEDLKKEEKVRKR